MTPLLWGMVEGSGGFLIGVMLWILWDIYR